MAHQHHKTDNELLLALNQGESAAYTELYERYKQVLLKHAYRILHDEDEAMDVVQDCFEKLWKQSNALEIKTSLKSYLYTMVRNRTLDMINKSRHREEYVVSLADYVQVYRPVTEETVLFRELTNRIEEEVKNLPTRMRQIFELSRFEGLSQREIAEEMDISENTVKSTINRVLKVLRGKLTSLLLWFF